MLRLRALLPSLLLLVSVAAATDEISVERQADGVIVRSPAAQANFLFRTPLAFEQTDAADGFAVELLAKAKGGAAARIRLRLGSLGAGQARRGLDALVKEKESAYLAGYGKELQVTGEENRRLATARRKGGVRYILVVVDGPRLYELFLEAAPGEGPLADALRDIADGFTILDPKGTPLLPTAASGDLKAETITHDFYRLTLLKPEGFAQREVDPDRDKGIYLHLRREDEQRNRADIFIRVFLTRASKESVRAKAQKRIDQFRQKYPGARGPKKPKRTGYSGAEEAYKFKLAGKVARTGIVVEEEWRLIKHSNGRIYEIQLVTYGGAARMWKKQIQAFWKKLKIKH